MRTATIFLTLFIFSYIMVGLGWDSIEIPLFMGLIFVIGLAGGTALAIFQDIKELKD